MENGPIKQISFYLVIIFLIVSSCGTDEIDSNNTPSKLQEALFYYFDVTSSLNGNGQFTSSSSRVKEGDKISITITPDENWALSSVKENGTELLDDGFFSTYNFEKIIDEDYNYEIEFCLYNLNNCSNDFNSNNSNVEYFIEEDGFDQDYMDPVKILNFKNGFNKAQQYLGGISNINVFMYHKQEYVERGKVFDDFKDLLEIKLIENKVCGLEQYYSLHNYYLQYWLLEDSGDLWRYGDFKPLGFTRTNMLLRSPISYCFDQIYLWVNMTSSSPSIFSPYIDNDFYFHIGVESYVNIIQTFKFYNYFDSESLTDIPYWFSFGEREFLSHYISEKENLRSNYFNDSDIEYRQNSYHYPPTISIPTQEKYFIELLKYIDQLYEQESYIDIQDNDSYFNFVRFNSMGGWAVAYLFYINDYNFDLVFKEFRRNLVESSFEEAFNETFETSVDEFLDDFYDFIQNNENRNSILNFN